MSSGEWKRLDAVRRIKQAALTVVEAAQLLGVSERQVRRIVKAVAKRGARGVVHGNTGRPPPNSLKGSVRKRIVALMRSTYVGFNDHHFTEKLVEVEKIQVSRAAVQRVLRAAGIGAARKRRPPKHRRRRDRKLQAGLMILWDGSRHDWLEGRGPMLCLMGAIDDATSDMLPGAHFVEQECAEGYLRVLLAIAREKGLPWSVYMDRHSSLKRNDNFWTLEEELRGKQDPTQVLRALELLDVEVIYALSAQAKGRIERLWGTAQDRLTSELRLAKAKTVEEANAVLREYAPDHNRRFAVPAMDLAPAWRPVRKELNLERICSFCYEATVSNDNVVRLAGAPVIDIPPGPGGRGYAQARVEVRQFLDGSWRVYFRDALIAAVAPATAAAPGELRALKRRKRSATARAFRRGVQRIAASLP